jgi:hypothetical protein
MTMDRACGRSIDGESLTTNHPPFRWLIFHFTGPEPRPEGEVKRVVKDHF